MNLAEQLARWGPLSDHPRPSLKEAEAYCRALATSHYENFSVVNWLFPKHLHQHLCNVYSYCRWADDLADEAQNPEQATELLAWWEQQLEHREESCHPVFVALNRTIAEKQIPLEPFRHLLIAFRQDQVQTRYETWDDLLGYCRNSADPVGQLVLHLGQSATAENIARSNSVCTGLQLINFCQDVSRDFAKGRIYLPRHERAPFGWNDDRFALQAASKSPPSQAFRDLLQAQVKRAEDLLRSGESLVQSVHRDLRLPVRLFINGGLAIARAIRQQRFDVWTSRPVVSKWQKLMLLAKGWFFT
ncbi:squalene synthase HpnC [Anatilimnocola sp. NA78]|uniref:squalene synthase HpnC n=1 Tax=Anatilimnocola sp. NA78 TaxID=3415683 RepID=UPI003CE4BC7B